LQYNNKGDTYCAVGPDYVVDVRKNQYVAIDAKKMSIIKSDEKFCRLLRWLIKQKDKVYIELSSGEYVIDPDDFVTLEFEVETQTPYGSFTNTALYNVYVPITKSVSIVGRKSKIILQEQPDVNSGTTTIFGMFPADTNEKITLVCSDSSESLKNPNKKFEFSLCGLLTKEDLQIEVNYQIETPTFFASKVVSIVNCDLPVVCDVELKNLTADLHITTPTPTKDQGNLVNSMYNCGKLRLSGVSANAAAGLIVDGESAEDILVFDVDSTGGINVYTPRFCLFFCNIEGQIDAGFPSGECDIIASSISSLKAAVDTIKILDCNIEELIAGYPDSKIWIVNSSVTKVFQTYGKIFARNCNGIDKEVITSDVEIQGYLKAAELYFPGASWSFKKVGSSAKTVTMPLAGGIVTTSVNAADLGMAKINFVLNVQVVKTDPEISDVYYPQYGINATGDAVGITLATGTGTTLTYSVTAFGI